MRVAWWTALALTALAATSVGADEWSRRFPIERRADLRLMMDDGDVRIEGGSGQAIEARVTTKGWRIDPGEVSVTAAQDGDRVEIEVRLPDAMVIGIGYRSIDVVLRVPAASDLEVRTDDGNATLRGVSGRHLVSTGDGDLDADDVEGDLRLLSGDGSIRASGLAGRLEAETEDGDIDVAGRFDALDLRTDDGDIDARLEAGSRVESAWALRTRDGGITLRLAEGLGADLDARTGDGSISIDKPLSVTGTIRRKAVQGRLGAGGPPLRLRSDDGSIRILAP